MYIISSSSSKNQGDSSLYYFLKKEGGNLLGFTCFFLFFFFVFKSQNLLVVPSQHQLSWANKLLSMLHAVIILLSVILFLTEVIAKDTWIFLINITRGYFSASILLHLLYPSTSYNIFQDFIHHIAVFLILAYSHKHPRYIAIGLMCEVTQVPLYFAWYLLKWDLGDSLAFKIVAAITLLTYLLFRILLFSYLFLHLYQRYQKNPDQISYKEVVVMLPILVLSYYWFWLLMQKAYTQMC